MYCRKCGKQIGDDAEYCNECKQKEIANRQAERFGHVAPPGERMIGFGKALASVIVGLLSNLIMVFSKMASGPSTPFFILLGLGLAISALIMGIKSIKCFFNQRKSGAVRPFPTLILGIVGMGLSASYMLFVFQVLFLLILYLT